ncbi:MAG: ABC transporter permease, partial [Coprobacillaceae bacterium]
MSRDYAETGTYLKDEDYSAIVRLKEASEMSQSTITNRVKEIGEECGIDRKYINDNNNFVNTLSGDAVQTNELLVIIGAGIGVLFVSILVIYSVFYLSVVGRIRQFGQLRTIGMTKKQVKKMITREGMLLSIIGIPLGIIIGSFIGYLVQPTGWDWGNTMLVSIVVVIADIITVMASIHKPAKIASSITPAEAARYSGYTEDKKAKKITK